MATPQTCDDQWHNDVQQDRQDQRVPGDMNFGQAEQQRDDRCKCEHHDHIVQRHLRQRKVRFAAHQVAPDKHHCRTRCGCEYYQAGDVGVDLVRGKVFPKHETDEKPGE